MGTYVAGTESPGTGIPATSETAASAKKSSARKNNTFDNFIMFGRVEMIKERRYERMWRIGSDRGQLLCMARKSAFLYLATSDV